MKLQALIPLLLLGMGACARSGPPLPPETVVRLSHMLLAPPQVEDGDWLLVGRYEVTREEFGLDSDPSAPNLPVTMVSYHAAEDWCEERGLRLPTLAEWRSLASGNGETSYLALSARNSLALDLRRPLPVGVFERGRTALGAYDFFGNVRELVLDTWDGRFYACGGSFTSRGASARANEQLEVHPGDRADDIGFRYVADASAYFLERVVPLWPKMDAEVKAHLQRSFEDWRPATRTAFSNRLQLDGAPLGLCRLLAGE